MLCVTMKKSKPEYVEIVNNTTGETLTVHLVDIKGKQVRIGLKSDKRTYSIKRIKEEEKEQ